MEDVKKVARNFFNLNLINVLGLIIPLLTMPWLSRGLGQDGYGVVLLAAVVHQIGILVVDYSFNIGGARDVSRAIGVDDLSRLYASIQSARYVLFVVFSLPIILYLRLADVGLSSTDYLLCIAPGIIGHIWFASWFYLGKSDLSLTSGLMLGSRLLYLAAVMLFVDSNDDVSVAILSNSLPLLMFGFIALWCTYKRTRVPIRVPVLAVTEIKKGLPLFIADFSPNLYNNLPALYLAHSVSKSEFAIYAVAVRIINAATSIQYMLGRSMLPVLAKRKEVKVRLIMLVNLVLALVICLVIVVSANWVVLRLVGPGYDVTTSFLRILAPSLVFVAISLGLTSGHYVRNDLDRELRNINLMISITAFLAGVPLILLYEVWGAVILLIFARVLMAVGMSVHYIGFSASRVHG